MPKDTKLVSSTRKPLVRVKHTIHIPAAFEPGGNIWMEKQIDPKYENDINRGCDGTAQRIDFRYGLLQILLIYPRTMDTSDKIADLGQFCIRFCKRSQIWLKPYQNR